MPYRYVRFSKPNVAFKGDLPVTHSVWTSFEFVRLDPVISDQLTMVIVQDASKTMLRAPRIYMVSYPAIVQITREFEGYDSCSTFDVSFSETWPDGHVIAKDPMNQRTLVIPWDFLDEAAFHLHQRQPVAV
jgi:hypothetical protein